MTSHELLLDLGKANLAAAAASIIVAVLRRPARRLFGPRLAYGLWLTPALAAAAVLMPARSVSIILPPIAAAPARALPPVSDLGALPYAMPAPDGPDLFVLGQWAWIAGMAAMALWLTLKQLEFMGAVRRGVAGPAVVGFVRPRIVTPADFERRFTAREQLVVLVHERTHILRQDARVNALVAAARCLCWFNPLVHVAAFLMRIDQELACDAAVVADHPKARRPYAEAMLKAELADRPLPLGCFWPAGTQHPLTERIAMLKINPSPARRRAGLACVTTLSAAAAAAAWSAQPAQVMLVTPPARPASTAPGPVGGPPVLAAAVPVQPAATKAIPATSLRPPPPGWEAFAARFDADKPVTMTGHLTKADFTNSYVQLFIHGDDGKDWQVRGPMTSYIPAEDRKVLPVGETIKLRGYLAKDPACTPNCQIMARNLTYASGQPVFPTETTPDTPYDTIASLKSADWSGAYVILHVVEPNGQAWALTGGSINTMLRSGISRAAMTPGMSLKLKIDPRFGPRRCDDECRGVARSIAFPDGRMVFIGAPSLSTADWGPMVRRHATAAQLVRAAQARGELRGFDPNRTAVVIDAAGQMVDAYPMTPLAPLTGGGQTVSFVGVSDGFGYPAGTVVLRPEGTGQPERSGPGTD